MVVIKDEKNKIEDHYHVVKGYVTETKDKEYLSWASDNSLVELTSAEAKKYPKYQPNEKYNSTVKYSIEFADEILKTISK